MRSDVSEVSEVSLGATTQTKISHVSVGPVLSVPINRGWFTDDREHRPTASPLGPSASGFPDPHHHHHPQIQEGRPEERRAGSGPGSSSFVVF